MNIISDGASHVHGHRAEVLGSRQKSPPIIVDPAGIPADIKLLPRWVNWCWKWNGKKWDKPPLQLDAKTLASSTKPETWSSFDEALESHQREHVGIGFVLNGDGIVGIDLDNCRDPETGQIADWARGYITRLATYCEVSPSGTGVKLLIRGRLPEIPEEIHSAQWRSRSVFDGPLLHTDRPKVA